MKMTRYDALTDCELNSILEFMSVFVGYKCELRDEYLEAGRGREIERARFDHLKSSAIARDGPTEALLSYVNGPSFAGMAAAIINLSRHKS